MYYEYKTCVNEVNTEVGLSSLTCYTYLLAGVALTGLGTITPRLGGQSLNSHSGYISLVYNGKRSNYLQKSHIHTHILITNILCTYTVYSM